MKQWRTVLCLLFFMSALWGLASAAEQALPYPLETKIDARQVWEIFLADLPHVFSGPVAALDDDTGGVLFQSDGMEAVVSLWHRILFCVFPVEFRGIEHTRAPDAECGGRELAVRAGLAVFAADFFESHGV